MFLNEKIIIKLKLLLKRWYEEMSDIWFKIAIKKNKLIVLICLVYMFWRNYPVV